MEEAELATLVEHVASGGAAAAKAETEVCRRFAPRIRLYGLRHLRADDRAEDLVQVVLMATLEAARAGRIEDPARLDRFVLGTCRNATLRMRERAARHDLREEPELDRAAEMHVHMNVETVDLDALFRCIAALDERHRTVVQLSFQEERPANEIATRVGTTPANVRVLRHRAIAQLRACIDRRGAP